MMDANKETHQVTYDVFYISDALSGFRLFIDGFHGNGDLKDDLSIEHSGIAGGMGTVFVWIVMVCLVEVVRWAYIGIRLEVMTHLLPGLRWRPDVSQKIYQHAPIKDFAGHCFRDV